MNDKVKKQSLAAQMAAATPEDGVGLLAGLRAREAFDLILEHDDPARIVELIPFESLYLMLQEVNSEDAITLLELANPEQVQGFLDIDCWDRDHLDMAKTRTWFLLLNELDEDAFIQHLSEIDLAMLVTFFSHHLQIHKKDSQDDEFEIEGVVTPDSRHLIEYTCSTEISRLMNSLFYKIAQMDLDFFYKLVEAIYWEAGSEVEEFAYQGRSSRLEGRGFPDYYTALEVLATVDLDHFKPSKKISSSLASKEPGARISSSQYLVKYDHPETLLRRVLAVDFAERDDIALEIMALANMITIASQTPFFELEQVRRLVARTDGFISIGLEHLSGGDVEQARDILITYRIIDIHKIGRTLMMNQARRARHLLPRMSLDAKSASHLLFDGLEHDWLAGLLQSEPARVVDGKDELWTELAQVRQTAANLETIEHFISLMEKRFHLTPAVIRELPLVGANLPDAADLSYRVLINTFRAHDLLGHEPSFALLDLVDLPVLRGMLETPRHHRALPAAAHRQFTAWLQAAVAEAHVKPLLAIFDRYAQRLADETAREDLAPRFRQELLLRVK